jgi:hypothetical protein
MTDIPPTAPLPEAPTSRTKSIRLLPVADLLLDPENPRLAEDGKALTDDQLVTKLYTEEALDELATSFANNGYFWEEPLVVVPHESIQGKFVVVEGNRRLATLKLLLSPTLRSDVSVTDFPDISAERRQELMSVPTVDYSSRSDVIPYLGFRHITGAKKWEPYAKARYISHLIRDGKSIVEIERAIGDSGQTTKKLYQAFVVFEQIKNDLEEDVHQIKERFSLLEVMLGQQDIKKHIGIPRRLPTSAVERVVDDDHLELLRETVHWVFGSRKGDRLPVIADSREISRLLAPVIANEQSLAHLRETRDLRAAFERTGGERDYLHKQLAAARRSAERALALSPHFAGDVGLVGEVERLLKVVQALESILRV